ncbi:MAG: pantoate--beta-alanine ligase [Anaerolineae bacterium]
MEVVQAVERLNLALDRLPRPFGVVLTMGALHAGHIALAEQAREVKALGGSLLATIFVNPMQFGPKEDLSAYPRDLDGDLAKLGAAGADLVFTPTPEMMYPPGFQTSVEVGEVAHGLEGSRRPGHFKGVATVVSKLLNLTRADTAYFGQKDAQQVAVIKRMVRDLNMRTQVVVIPTVREADGLAMSSRNAYLSEHQRRAASVLNRALQAAGEAYERGERMPKVLRWIVQRELVKEPLIEMDYVSAADARTLQELHDASEAPVLLSLAVRVGRTRLLDNCLLPLPLNNRTDLTAILGAG